jgi:hypothetical protein
MRSTTDLSSSVSPPCSSSTTSLPSSAGGVAHHAAKAREGLADRHHAQLQRAVADLLDQAADLLVGLDQRPLARLLAPASRRRRWR